MVANSIKSICLPSSMNSMPTMVIPAMKHSSRCDTWRDQKSDLDGHNLAQHQWEIVVRVMNRKNSRVLSFLVVCLQSMNREMKEESKSYINTIYFGNLQTIIFICETFANPLEQTNLTFSSGTNQTFAKLLP